MSDDYDYSECDETADNMPLLPKDVSFTDALRFTREQMLPGESETVISNVAYALWRRSTAQ